jgi:4-alpha-glucanotransferase
VKKISEELEYKWRRVKIIGDMPIYVGGHSADVWSNQKLFDLGPTGAPANVSGVPPDAFSETGRTLKLLQDLLILFFISLGGAYVYI